MLNNCFYYINKAKVTSSNLVTPTKSPNFQTLCFLPVFKAQQGFETYLTDYFTNLLQYLSKTFTTILQQICGYHVVSKKFNGYQFYTDDPLDILGAYAYNIIINANIGE
tara:strand:+ start:163 stop:489 length:327 start_codon:yes stop_codon:yes gene_type:complete